MIKYKKSIKKLYGNFNTENEKTQFFLTFAGILFTGKGLFCILLQKPECDG